MASGTITFADGTQHTCRFGEWWEYPWRSTYDPPHERVPHPAWPQYRIYQPVPGVEHHRVTKQAFSGTVYDSGEWYDLFLRGYV